MCKTTTSDKLLQTPSTSSSSTPFRSKQEEQEFEISRKCKWFMVRYFDRLTLSGDKTRYVFVNASQYGIVWPNVAFFVLMHGIFCYAMYNVFAYNMMDIWLASYLVGVWGGLGVTAGAHRLWSHKSYSAALPVRIFLMILFTSAGENDLFTWCRDHRLHHKYTETDADPHNSRRGGFFAHVGWLLTKKHPDVIIKGATIDNRDLMEDPVVRYNRKYYSLMYFLFRVYFPAAVPHYLCHISWWKTFVGTFAYYVGSLHTVWFVNSAAHIFGHRPYNPKIQPRENFWVSVTGMGEGFHNYHHTFPWDYRIAENGLSWWNPAKWVIDGFHRIGLTYNLKMASPELVEKTRKKASGQTKDKDFYVHDHPYAAPHAFSDGG